MKDKENKNYIDLHNVSFNPKYDLFYIFVSSSRIIIYPAAINDCNKELTTKEKNNSL